MYMCTSCKKEWETIANLQAEASSPPSWRCLCGGSVQEYGKLTSPDLAERVAALEISLATLRGPVPEGDNGGCVIEKLTVHLKRIQQLEAEWVRAGGDGRQFPDRFDDIVRRVRGLEASPEAPTVTELAGIDRRVVALEATVDAPTGLRVQCEALEEAAHKLRDRIARLEDAPAPATPATPQKAADPATTLDYDVREALQYADERIKNLEAQLEVAQRSLEKARAGLERKR